MQVVKAPDPKLKIQTKPVKKISLSLLQTFKDMVKLTKTFTDPEGVGLASTQVGLNEQFFVAKVPEQSTKKKSSTVIPSKEGIHTNKQSLALRANKSHGSPIRSGMTGGFITVINPKITWTSKKTKKYFEGCLSIPNYWGEVGRFLGIKVTYIDETGKVINANLKGVLAWIFQHEIDHLNGILFSERVLEQKGKFYRFTGKDKTGTDIFEEISI